MSSERTKTVASADDPALDVFRDLKDRELRAREGLFIAESANVVWRLLASNLEVPAVLTTPNRLDHLRDVLRPDTTVFVAESPIVNRTVGFDAGRVGVFACGRRPKPQSLADALAASTGSPNAPIIALENVNDPQNIGSILRSADALGARLVLLGGCCDPYYRKAIRVSMGAVFRLRPHCSEDLRRDLQELRATHGYRLLAAATGTDSTSVSAVPPVSKTTVVLGAEGPGLSDEVRNLCGRTVEIPVRPGSDSLNVAVAAGVLLHHFVANSASS